MPTKPSVDIDQRAATVAGVDAGIGLNEIFDVRNAQITPLFGRDDTLRHGRSEAERAANCNDNVADLGRVRIGPLHGGQRLIGVDFQYGKVGVGVGSQQRRFELTAVAQVHCDGAGVLDYMIVGDDDATTIHNNARTKALRSLIRLAERVAKKVAKAASRHDLFRIDVDYSGRNAARERGIRSGKLLQSLGIGDGLRLSRAVEAALSTRCVRSVAHAGARYKPD
jgi:hypothetical protein